MGARRLTLLLLAAGLWPALGANAALAASPVVAITSPASGATVSGTVTVAATVTSANPVASVVFRVDGATVATDTTTPYATAWATRTVANGVRRLAVVATDNRGNRTTVTRNVTVSNTADTTAPTVAFSSPAAGATLTGSVGITATASDSSGVASVRFLLDGQTLSTDTTSPYAHGGWNTAAAADGTHTLSAVATDTRGNVRTVTRTVTTSNDLTGPSLALTGPAAGATLTGSLDIIAVASDPSGVASVRFAVDGQTLSTDATAPYVHGGWDTTLLADGDHTISLVAIDTRGNTTTVTHPVAISNAVPDTTGPALAFGGPSADATVTGIVDITATASDPSGVAGVSFMVDGEEISADTAAPYVHGGWDTTLLADGDHTISLVATDTLGNTSTLARTVTVARPGLDVSGPDVTITSPDDGATISGLVDIAASAADPSGVASVTFAVDGDVLSTDTEAPYEHSGWDTLFLGLGPYEISVVATDQLGHRTTVSRIVTVPFLPGPLPPTSGSLPGTVLQRGDLETGDLTQFSGIQRVAADRIQVVGSPTAEGSWASRFEVRQGDAWQGSSGNRAEVVMQTAEGEGDERWYQWSTMFAPDYPYVDSGFQIVTQWHATVGSSQPMLVFFAVRDEVGFKTVESSADLTPRPSVVHWRGPMKRGSWHTFRLHVMWSSNPALGSVELWHNGTKVAGPVAVATMIPGQGVYFKQGLYRSASHAAVGVVHHDGFVTTRVP